MSIHDEARLAAEAVYDRHAAGLEARAEEAVALADESDSTYLESSAISGTEQTIRLRVEPSGARATGKVQATLGMDTGTGTFQVSLLEGTTLRQSWTQAGVGSTATAYEFALNTGTISAITDWGNLYLEFGVTS